MVDPKLIWPFGSCQSKLSGASLVKRCFVIGIVSILFSFSCLNSYAENRNFRIGAFNFDLAATFQAEYNDNINGATNNPISDVILTPGIWLGGEWKATELNTLSVSVGLGYSKYLSNPELDSSNNFLNINPDTEISFTAFVEDFTIEVFDRITYTVDATDALLPNNNNPIDYGRFINLAGINVDWDLNDVILFMSFTRLDVIPTTDDFDFQSRTEHRLEAGPRFLVAPNLTLGLTGSIAWNQWHNSGANGVIKNNSVSYSLGPMAIWQPTSVINVSASGGVIWFDFQNNDPTVSDDSNPVGFFGNIAVTHRLTQNYTHSLAFSRSYNYGYLSNFTIVDSLIYGWNWRLGKKINPRGRFGWDRGNDSGGPSPEDYDRFFVGVGMDYRFSNQIVAGLNYEWSHRNSNIPNRTFDRNRVWLTLRYDF